MSGVRYDGYLLVERTNAMYAVKGLEAIRVCPLGVPMRDARAAMIDILNKRAQERAA